MQLSIIIPTKDRGEVFYQTLKLAHQAIEQVEAEIIVVNDSKTNKLNLNALYTHVKIYNNPKNGVASARNYGASHAKGDILLFLDDDMLINEGNIQTTLQLHHAYGACCIMLNWIYPPGVIDKIKNKQFGRYLINYGFTSLKGWNKETNWDDNNLFSISGITSQYLSMFKSTFIESGGYNESFPHAGYEDFEFAQRLQKLNKALYIFPSSMVFHNEIDRLDLQAWLARKKRGSETRKAAVKMGYSELTLKPGLAKKMILQVLILLKPILYFLLKLIPNKRVMDFFFFKLVNILLATVIFEGYNRK